jgi:hypothetical protein
MCRSLPRSCRDVRLRPTKSRGRMDVFFIISAGGKLTVLRVPSYDTLTTLKDGLVVGAPNNDLGSWRDNGGSLCKSLGGGLEENQ